ncbi:hypothetical protein ACFL52_00195 [Candidatus Margulisiibacteriota bacterium]
MGMFVTAGRAIKKVLPKIRRKLGRITIAAATAASLSGCGGETSDLSPQNININPSPAEKVLCPFLGEESFDYSKKLKENIHCPEFNSFWETSDNVNISMHGTTDLLHVCAIQKIANNPTLYIEANPKASEINLDVSEYQTLQIKLFGIMSYAQSNYCSYTKDKNGCLDVQLRLYENTKSPPKVVANFTPLVGDRDFFHLYEFDISRLKRIARVELRVPYYGVTGYIRLGVLKLFKKPPGNCPVKLVSYNKEYCI